MSSTKRLGRRFGPATAPGASGSFGADPMREVARFLLAVLRAGAAAFVALGVVTALLGGVVSGSVTASAAALVLAVVTYELRSRKLRVQVAFVAVGIVTFLVRVFAVVAQDPWTLSTNAVEVILVVGGLIAVLHTERRVWSMVAFWAALVVAATGLATSMKAATTIAFVDAVGVGVAFLAATVLIRLIRSALDDRQSRYRSIMDNAPIGIVEVDVSRVETWMEHLRGDGIEDLAGWLDADRDRFSEAMAGMSILSANRRSLDLLGFPSTAALAGALRTLAPGAAPARSMRLLLDNMWCGELTVRHELTFSDPTGEQRTLLFVAAPADLGADDRSRLLVTLVDIQAQKNAEYALEHQLDARDRFVASVSHELRTPIAAVHGLAKELVDRPADFAAAERQELLGLVARASGDVAGIVDDLLVMARTGAGELTMEAAPVHVAAVVRDVIAELQLPAVQVDVADSVVANADPMRLMQIMRNLVSNADRYGGPSVRVVAEVDTAGGGEHVVIQVRDNGAPVDLRAQQRMFEPYERLHTVAGTTDSMGLGLAVVRTLATLMAGDVSYRWEQGESVFSVRLPAYAASPHAAAAREPSNARVRTSGRP